MSAKTILILCAVSIASAVLAISATDSTAYLIINSACAGAAATVALGALVMR